MRKLLKAQYDCPGLHLVTSEICSKIQTIKFFTCVKAVVPSCNDLKIPGFVQLWACAPAQIVLSLVYRAVTSFGGSHCWQR